MCYIDFILLTGENSQKEGNGREGKEHLSVTLALSTKLLSSQAFVALCSHPTKAEESPRMLFHPQAIFEGYKGSPLMRNKIPQRQRVRFHNGPGEVDAVLSF